MIQQFQKLRDHGLDGLYTGPRHVEHDDRNRQRREILLKFQIAVSRDECVEAARRKSKEYPVLDAGPAS